MPGILAGDLDGSWPLLRGTVFFTSTPGNAVIQGETLSKNCPRKGLPNPLCTLRMKQSGI